MNSNSSTKDQQKNQEKLMEEEHTIIRILISRIGRCKEKVKARRGPAQWT
jgi:uncharacterized membrane protein